ncbi:MAG: 4-hydroxy-tetrahydrodipicolinate reductase [Lachnospiraceae bacterium]|nr:4-hydroxy-tetrahydrodipicolinate reductase [Lachnospiraceae bacterium]
MTKIIMHGCNGKMGQVITALCKEENDLEIVAGVDISNHITQEYPVFSRIDDCDVEADVIIDFASVKAVDALLAYSVLRKIPVVLCTTGLDSQKEQALEQASKNVAVLKSANMSLGINLLMDVLKKAVHVLASAGFDMEIIEKHHNQKIDAPSGTALALAEVLNEELDHGYTYQFDRTKERKKRDKQEIGIHAVRGGNIVGEHEVIFAGTDEVITFSHTAYSKQVFAKGAIEAAKFLKGKPKGLYHMGDVIEAK